MGKKKVKDRPAPPLDMDPASVIVEADEKARALPIVLEPITKATLFKVITAIGPVTGVQFPQKHVDGSSKTGRLTFLRKERAQAFADAVNKGDKASAFKLAYARLRRDWRGAKPEKKGD